MTDVTIRKARFQDARQIWQIRNSSPVRKNSTNSSPISYAAHLSWFRRYLSNPHNHIFVLEIANNKIVGYCRYDRQLQNLTTSIAIAATHRSKGFGTTILRETLKLLEKESLPFTANLILQSPSPIPNIII